MQPKTTKRMTTFQIIGIVIVALIGLGIFYAIYRIERHDYPDQKKGKDGLLADLGLTQIGHCNIPIRNLLRRIYLYNNVICY